MCGNRNQIRGKVHDEQDEKRGLPSNIKWKSFKKSTERTVFDWKVFWVGKKVKPDRTTTMQSGITGWNHRGIKERGKFLKVWKFDIKVKKSKY